jgi:hypothetical protein
LSRVPLVSFERDCFYALSLEIAQNHMPPTAICSISSSRAVPTGAPMHMVAL